jgi:purine-cytosine permease-like protein
MRLFVEFSLFGFLGLGVIVFPISIFALNDANLYEAVNAVQNVLNGRRRPEVVVSLGIVGASLAILMARSSSLQSDFFTSAGICAVCLPCATIVMAVDVFLIERLSGCSRRTRMADAPLAVVSWAEASIGNVAGITAILSGVAVGALFSSSALSQLSPASTSFVQPGAPD